jgi:hypothetical protein
VFNPWNEEGRRGKRSADAVRSSGHWLHGGRDRAALGGGGNWRWGSSPTSVQKEEEGPSGPSGRKAKRAGWLAGPAGPKSEENSFPNKNWIIKYTNALKICLRRLRRNFDMGIFPKFF